MDETFCGFPVELLTSLSVIAGRSFRPSMRSAFHTLAALLTEGNVFGLLHNGLAERQVCQFEETGQISAGECMGQGMSDSSGSFPPVFGQGLWKQLVL